MTASARAPAIRPFPPRHEQPKLTVKREEIDAPQTAANQYQFYDADDGDADDSDKGSVLQDANDSASTLFLATTHKLNQAWLNSDNTWGDGKGQ